VRLLRHIKVDARAIAGALIGQVTVGFFHGIDTSFHVEDLRDLFIGQKNHRL
jgi:hypothetical protein